METPADLVLGSEILRQRIFCVGGLIGSRPLRNGR
jgi:hypothetical protein